MKNILKIIGCSLAVFSLVACQGAGKEITAEEAEEIIEKMEEFVEKNEIKKLTTKVETKAEAIIESSIFNMTSKNEAKTTLEYDLDVIYCHIVEKGTTSTISEGKETKEPIDMEQWFYYKDGSYYDVYKDGNEKEYTASEMSKELALIELATDVSMSSMDITESVTGPAGMIFEGGDLEEYGLQSEVKYYSKGDNDLTIQTKIVGKEGNSTDISNTVHYTEGYVASSTTKGNFDIEIDLGDILDVVGDFGENMGALSSLLSLMDLTATVKGTADETASSSKKCDISYPDLSKFEKVEYK